ncbi:MAG TPA: 3D domain-containing protein, partial [Bradyrhizobium sp.]|nr:3D domain-containing protein [Bradyrhizobium sp.]
EQSKTPFRRLMIAQDTGSAITGPARADLYFGAGVEAGRVSGRLRSNMRFAILVPRSLDPVARGRKMPLPDARPSEKIAKLFPQVDPLKDQKPKDQTQKDQNRGAKPTEASAAPGSKDTFNAREPAKTAAPTAPPPAAAVAQASTPVAVAKPIPLPEARPNSKPAPELRRQRRYRDYLRVR